MPSNDYMEFGFDSGDEGLGGGKFERFKGKEGEIYRMSFVWWDLVDGKPNLKAASPRFIGAKRFYFPNAGYILDRGPEYAKLAGGPSKATIATIVALWPVDRKGQIDKTRFAQGDVDIKPWVFSQDKYDQLKRRHNEFPFGEFDLNVTCVDTTYQKMDLSPARDNLYLKVLQSEKLTALADVIAGKVAAIVGANPAGEPVGLRGIIARDMPLDKLREKLGAAPGGGAAFSPQTTTELDGMLDDLIE